MNAKKYKLPRAVARKLYTDEAATSTGVFPFRFLMDRSAPRSTNIFTSFNWPTMAASTNRHNQLTRSNFE